MEKKDLMQIGIWIFFFFVFGVSYANYNLTGEFNFDLSLVIYFIGSHPIISTFVIIVLIFIIFIQYKIYRRNLRLRKNCQIQYVELEKIAVSWLDNEDIEKNIEFNIRSSMEQDTKEVSEIISGTLDVIFDRDFKDITFFKNYVKPYLKSFSEIELSITLDLYELLENDAKNTPSVGILYNKDSDATVYNKKTSITGETDYQLLHSINLFEHTMNVVEFTYAYLLDNEKESFVFFYPKCLIIALGHDIGKITNGKIIKNTITNTSIYQTSTHESISKAILGSCYPEYEGIDIVCEAIAKHHINASKEPSPYERYMKVLNYADTKAREKEIKNILTERKNKITDAIEQTVEVTKEKFNLSENVSEIKKQTVEVTKEIVVLEDKSDEVVNTTAVGEITTLLIDNINKVDVKQASGMVKVLSISHKEKLFVPKECLFSYFTKAKIDRKNNKEVSKILDYMKNDGLFKGYQLARLENFGTKSYQNTKEYAVFDATYLGFEESALELSKRENEYLRNTTIIV